MSTLIEELRVLHNNVETDQQYTLKDFKTDQEVRWCPGCGDYAILAQMQKLMPELGIAKEDIVFISGIGCSSRFPYYMNTYGFHTIHGRAPAIASGLKIARPELSVWVITGDGDALSIGGNHFIHLLRRNVDLNVLLFNNEIYGLTKGQYSPTSSPGHITKSTPMGSLDHPFNPTSLALGASATFVGRTLDRDLKHMGAMLRRTAEHKGTSFLEIYQNCVVFNDGAFFDYTEKDTKPDFALFVEHGKPLVFGREQEKGIRFDGMTPTVVRLDEGYSIDDLLVYNEKDLTMATIISNMTMQPSLPRPFGIFYSTERPQYEQEVIKQLEKAVEKRGKGNVDELLRSGDTWVIA